jgi:hypothetical protein
MFVMIGCGEMTVGSMNDVGNVDGWMRDGDDGDSCMMDKGSG